MRFAIRFAVLLLLLAATAFQASAANWFPLGGPTFFGGVSVGRNADGRLEVFVLAAGNIQHTWQTSPNGTWSSWSSLGGNIAAGVLESPAVGHNADGRLEVFAHGSAGDVQHIFQTAWSSSGWSGWSSLGGSTTGQLVVARQPDGRLVLFARATTGDVQWIRQDATSTGWSGWSSLGGNI